MILITRLVTCSEVTAEPPHTLVHVRRNWRNPPPSFAVFIEFFRQDEQTAFAWSIRILRGSTLIAETASELELPGGRFVEAAFDVSLQEAAAKTYTVEVLVDGVAEASTLLDFGSPEALP